VYSGKLDVRQVTGSLARWPTLLATACLFYLQRAVTAWRWNLLLRAREIRIGPLVFAMLTGFLEFYSESPPFGGDSLDSKCEFRSALC
jgi:hypothetical protein